MESGEDLPCLQDSSILRGKVGTQLKLLDLRQLSKYRQGTVPLWEHHYLLSKSGLDCKEPWFVQKHLFQQRKRSQQDTYRKCQMPALRL